MAGHVYTRGINARAPFMAPSLLFCKSFVPMEEKVELRTCLRCELTFPLSDFPIWRNDPSGHNRNLYCFSCKRKNEKESHRKCIARDPVRYRCKGLLASAKNRAKEKGLEFSLTLEHLLALAKRKRCPISNKLFTWKTHIDDHSSNQTADSPALDRIDPHRGYTPDNVWLIGSRMNTIKNDATPRELALISRAVNNEMMRRVCDDF